MESDKIKIRKAQSEDAQELCALICVNAEKLLKPYYSLDQWKIFITYYSVEVIKNKIDIQKIFCAELNNKIIGTIALDNGFVVGFYTHLDYVNQGIGTVMMNYIQNIAIEAGLKEILLAASPVGLKFYYKNGWEKVKDILIDHYGVGFEETLMKKHLK